MGPYLTRYSRVCNLTISLMYNLLSLAREKSVLIGMRCADLVNLSTMTQIALCLRNVVNNPVTNPW